MGQVSAGIVLFRESPDGIEVLLGHPGGPYFATRDTGGWSIPKGLVEDGEDLQSAARREWEEETGFVVPDGPWLDLGTTRLRSGKTVHAWGVAGDADPEDLNGNTFELVWPPRSGRHRVYPEIDRLTWADPPTARRLLNPAQAVFIERLLKLREPGADL